MGIVKTLKRLLGDNNEKSDKFKQMQEDDRLETMLEERKKSSNRRELEKYYKDKEEKEIKDQLDKIRKKRNKECWKSENQFFGQKATILNEDKKALSNDKSILKQKNIFTNKNQIKVKHGGQFFKW